MGSKRSSARNIGLALFFNVLFIIVEIIGGLLTNSIAITLDAIHDCGDTIAISISWVLEKISEKRPNERYTYGYMRFSFLGALINSLILLMSCTIILYETLPRLFNPQKVNYNGMIILSFLGIAFKSLGAIKTAKGEKINERAVSLHLMSDVLTWIATLITSFFIKISNIAILDSLLSIGIVTFILINLVKNLKLIFEVLLERAPKNVNVVELKKELLESKYITNAHHLHMWLADGVNTYATLHIVVHNGLSEIEISNVKKYVRKVINKHNIGHITIEIEFECERCKEDNCEFETQGFKDLKLMSQIFNHK